MPDESGFLTDEEYRTAYGLVPRLCVDLLVVRQDGQVLLTTRKEEPFKGRWHLPGGRVRKGESLLAAICRIALKEIGYPVATGRGFIGVMEFPQDKGDLGEFHSVSIAWCCCYDGPPPLSVSRWQWFRRAPELMHPVHRYFLVSRGFLLDS